MNNDYINEIIRPKDSLFSKNFSLTLKRDFIDNRKVILLTIAGILGICITIGTFLGFNMTGGSLGELSFCLMLFLAIGCVAASMAFSSLKRKDTRISILLLPDTMFDKFLVRWLAVVPILFCVLIVGFYCLEFTRIIVFKIVHSAADVPNYADYCKLLNPIRILNIAEDPAGGALLATMISSYFISQSCYVLGSALWPKLSFIKTFAVLWVLQTFVSIISMTIDLNLTKGVHIDGNTFFWCLTAVEAVVTFIIYILAYLRFKNTQVVNKLF